MTLPPMSFPADEQQDPFGGPHSHTAAFDEILQSAHHPSDNTQVEPTTLPHQDGSSGVEPTPLPPDQSDSEPDPMDPNEAAEGESESPSKPPSIVDLRSNHDTPEVRADAMRGLYGQDFPLAKDKPADEDFGLWVQELWARHRGGRRKRLHLTERNRLFRAGVQWISAQRTGPWREPPKSANAVRFVYNLIGPALDQRVQIIAEQRPGFRTRPTTQDPNDVRRAEAQQDAIEYQYTEQRMPEICREASYWAGTDGCAFLQVNWNPEAGPWHEHMDGTKRPMGDLRTRVLRIEQVAVSANASANNAPTYWIVKETIPRAEAIAMYGASIAPADMAIGMGNASMDPFLINPDIIKLGFEQPSLYELHEGQETIDRYMCYCAPSEFLPQGLCVLSMGNKVISVTPLLFGVVPMVRWTDGSTDPAFFPAPRMEAWLDFQTLINATVSKWIESVRQNAGGRFLTKPRALVTETLVGGLLSAIEVRSSGAIGDSIQQVQGMSIGSDAKDLLTLAKTAFEDVSGFSSESRGKFADGASGRAILAARESLERIFAEEVNQNARAMTEWSKVVLHGMRWGYDLKRTIGVFGRTRGDLARILSSDDFDGVADVEIDPETLMPMPRPLKLFLLDQLLEKQVITPQEYRRRMPFGSIRNIETPDEDHFARARRVADAIRRGQAPRPILWQDNEAIHQDVLERELLLDDDLDPRLHEIANQRWIALANQAALKAGGAPPGGAPAPPSPGGAPGDPMPMSPQNQPMLGTNPPIAAAPIAQSSGFQASRNATTMAQGIDRTKPY